MRTTVAIVIFYSLLSIRANAQTSLFKMEAGIKLLANEYLIGFKNIKGLQKETNEFYTGYATSFVLPGGVDTTAEIRHYPNYMGKELLYYAIEMNKDSVLFDSIANMLQKIRFPFGRIVKVPSGADCMYRYVPVAKNLSPQLKKINIVLWKPDDYECSSGLFTLAIGN